MREINSHKVNPANDTLKITVLDEAGSGGAHHEYRIATDLLQPEERYPAENMQRIKACCRIHFQNGPINEAGVNGITQEALLAICIDRLECFQAGPYACRENAIALTKLQEAQMWLQKRTRDRMARGVGGTHEK